MNDQQVVIIGGGPAGLACAAELRRVGVPSVVLERGDTVGYSWRGRHDRLRLNTSRWFSHFTGTQYPKGTGVFPTRDDMIRYLEDYTERNQVAVRLHTRVARVDRVERGWVVHTSSGEIAARQVIVATGLCGAPAIPDWPGRDRYGGQLLHAGEYRNTAGFRDDADVLVVGPGSSGMEIAYDLAMGGARRVRLSVRTPPNILLRSLGGLPGDPLAMVFLAMPPRVADAQIRAMRRLTIGDLSAYGLPAPVEGPFSRLHRLGTAPAIVDKEVLQAVKARRIEIVASVDSLDETGAALADGTRAGVGVIIAATGYRTGLEPLVGHLDVLDRRGLPRVSGAGEAAPGLRFAGYSAQPGLISYIGREAKRTARTIASVADTARPGQSRPGQ